MNHYQRENEAMIGWLSDKPTDMLHYVALLLNWDYAEPSAEWIVTQPDSDLATAVELFWLTSDCDFPSFPNREAVAESASYYLGSFDLADGIVSRAKAGFYTKSSISYNIDSDCYVRIKRYEQSEEQHRSKGLPWVVPSAFKRQVRLRDIDVRSKSSNFRSLELDRLLVNLGTNLVPQTY